MTLNIRENVSLKPYNTLCLEVKARYLLLIEEAAMLQKALVWAKHKQLAINIIGGGSNLVLTKDLTGLVLLMRTKGIAIIAEQGTQVIVEAAAGVVWQDLVQWSVEQNLGGLENLSSIYGTVGAAPVQNIGAYGVEFKDVCYSVLALHRETGQFHTFTADQCQFAYRDSVFKQQANQWIVVKVSLKLDRQAPINLSYAALQQNISEQSVPLTYAKVSQLVTNTRLQKLPNPKELANVGSFFKNPIVSLQKAQQLMRQYPDLVTYPYQKQQVKLAAGWLIDKAGLKGHREGQVGTYPKQALVLVNYGKATGLEILAFANKLQFIVNQKFGVLLELEPVVL